MTLTKVLKKAFTGGPNVDKESPELILDSCRVFRVEREDVADDDDGVQDDEHPHDDDVAKRWVQVANQLRQGTIEVDHPGWNLEHR